MKMVYIFFHEQRFHVNLLKKLEKARHTYLWSQCMLVHKCKNVGNGANYINPETFQVLWQDKETKFSLQLTI